VFARHVDLPRRPEREIVRERKQSYELNGREGEALATIGAFRVVPASDVQEMLGRELGERSARGVSIIFRRPACWSASRWSGETRTSWYSRTEFEICSKRIGVSTVESLDRIREP
jgi:hypothetical protein